MTTKTQKTHHSNDIICSIEGRHPNCYPSQAGSLKVVLTSVLIHVEVYDPKMFQKIMEFEMMCQESMEEMQDLAEADKDLI